jgi:hypothetical protein
MNNTGKPDEFVPFDEAQEHNNKDFKVTHRSEGPSVDWEYLKKLHPAIHVVRAVARLIELEFKTLTRGKKHTIPKKDLDVQTLHNSYHESRVHIRVPGRRSETERDKAKDVTAHGISVFLAGKVMKRWIDNRTFERSMEQEWDLPSSDDSSSGSETSEIHG